MSKFWDLLERSVIVQSILPVGFGGAVVYLAIIGIPVPSLLEYLTILTISFWMGTKVQHSIDNNRESKGRK